MKSENIQSSSRFRYWYLLLILGLLFVVVGVIIFMTPVQTFVTLSILFSVFFLTTGALEIVYAISNHDRNDNWGWALAGGILDMLIGALLISKPGISMAVLPFFVGFGVLFRAIMTIGWAFMLRKLGDRDWGWLLATGILGGIFAFILLMNPVFAGLTIAFYAGFAFMVIGIFQILLAFRLRKLR